MALSLAATEAQTTQHRRGQVRVLWDLGLGLTHRSGGGEVQSVGNTTIDGLGGASQLVVLRLDGALGVGSVLGSAVLDEVHFGLVVGVATDGVQLAGQISDVGLLVQDIDSGLLLGSLLGQSQGSVLQATVLGSLDEDNAQTLVHGAGNTLEFLGLVEVLLVGGEGEELLLELTSGSGGLVGDGGAESSRAETSRAKTSRAQTRRSESRGSEIDGATAEAATQTAVQAAEVAAATQAQGAAAATQAQGAAAASQAQGAAAAAAGSEGKAGAGVVHGLVVVAELVGTGDRHEAQDDEGAHLARDVLVLLLF
ncbi:hypothetical protein KR038_006763 [Drosophila bunnanda]|nr:hypothetical protein KR038_006763 [Drosophila bunnanda]